MIVLRALSNFCFGDVPTIITFTIGPTASTTAPTTSATHAAPTMQQLPPPVVRTQDQRVAEFLLQGYRRSLRTGLFDCTFVTGRTRGEAYEEIIVPTTYLRPWFFDGWGVVESAVRVARAVFSRANCKPFDDVRGRTALTACFSIASKNARSTAFLSVSATQFCKTPLVLVHRTLFEGLDWSPEEQNFYVLQRLVEQAEGEILIHVPALYIWLNRTPTLIFEAMLDDVLDEQLLSESVAELATRARNVSNFYMIELLLADEKILRIELSSALALIALTTLFVVDGHLPFLLLTFLESLVGEAATALKVLECVSFPLTDHAAACTAHSSGALFSVSTRMRVVEEIRTRKSCEVA